MEKVEIKTLLVDPAPYADQSITVCGWIKTLRNSKSITFIELTDGTAFKG